MSGGARAAVALVAVLALVAMGAAALALGAPPSGVTLERAEEVAEPTKGAEGPAEGEESIGDAGGEGAPGEAPEPEEEGAVPATVVVHVDGAVASPGVYELPAGSRANDAVSAAGGLAEGADTTALNLAAELADGEKIYVPLEGEGAAAPQTPSSAGAADAGGPVNLNTATAEELDELPGIGEATAQAILEDREANGPFASPEDLMRVSGIGEKKFERLEGLVCV